VRHVRASSDRHRPIEQKRAARNAGRLDEGRDEPERRQGLFHPAIGSVHPGNVAHRAVASDEDDAR
jgi:hypothetical protein